MDLVLGQGSSGEVWHNRGAAGLPPSCSCPTVTGVAVWPMAMAMAMWIWW